MEEYFLQTDEVWYNHADVTFKLFDNYMEVYYDELPRGRLFFFNNLTNSMFIDDFRVFCIETPTEMCFFEPSNIDSFMFKHKPESISRSMCYNPRGHFFISLDVRYPSNFVKTQLRSKSKKFGEGFCKNELTSKVYYPMNSLFAVQISEDSVYIYDPKVRQLNAQFLFEAPTKPKGIFSRKAVKNPAELDTLPTIEPIIKGFISPNSLYLYVLKATSNNSFTINLVDLKRRKHLSELKIIGKDLDDVEGCALNNGIVLSGIKRNKFVSFVSLEKKGKLKQLWDKPVDLKLFGQKPKNQLSYVSSP